MQGEKPNIVNAHAEYMRIKRQAELNKFLNYGLFFMFLVSGIIVICTIVAITIGDAMRSSPRAHEYNEEYTRAASVGSVSSHTRYMSMDTVETLATVSAPATDSQNVAFKALALRTLRGAAGLALKSRDGRQPATGFLSVRYEPKILSNVNYQRLIIRSKESFRGFMPDTRWKNCRIFPKVRPSYARRPRVSFVDGRDLVAYPRLLCSVAL